MSLAWMRFTLDPVMVPCNRAGVIREERSFAIVGETAQVDPQLRV
jgi:hypothetical protein